ncbi:unnamed protein product [Urochloa humidicola]
MAEPQQVFTISSVAEAQQVTGNRPADEVGLLVDAETPLNSAAHIKVRTHAGIRGIRVMNPELVDCKFHANNELYHAFKAMLGAWMKECQQEIHRVDLLIYTVKKKLAVPDASLPHRGPPENQRNQGICQYLHFGKYPIWDESAIQFQAPYDSAEERARAIQRDRDSQRAWWKLNLQFLEAKKEVPEEKARDLERRVRDIMDESIPLGCGLRGLRLGTCYQYLIYASEKILQSCKPRAA